MRQLDKILQALTTSERAASQALSIADKVRGVVGRGAPGWHRWRALRLRLRAARAEAAGRPNRADELRRRAAVHLRHAVVLVDSPVVDQDLADIYELLAGREPEAKGT